LDNEEDNVRRREDLPLQKVTLNLYEGDMTFLQDLYPRIGAGRAIRRLVRQFRERIESGAKKENATVSVEDIEL